MALYALGDGPIAASDADPGREYRCIECAKPVKVRKGKNRIPHFYHLRLSPSCRLYSKSEDHLLLQLQIQDLLPPKEAAIERVFPEIHRVSDVVWEQEKIAFEIQCSMIYPKEVKRRVDEYSSLGFRVVWILDDRVFNKRVLRPSEELLREQNGYYVSFRREKRSFFYDQFEIFNEAKRLKKSRRFWVDLRRPRPFPPIDVPEEWPMQVVKRAEVNRPYFPGDLLDRAILSAISIPHALSLQNWAVLEEQFRERGGLIEGAAKPLMDRLNALIAD